MVIPLINVSVYIFNFLDNFLLMLSGSKPRSKIGLLSMVMSQVGSDLNGSNANTILEDLHLINLKETVNVCFCIIKCLVYVQAASPGDNSTRNAIETP